MLSWLRYTFITERDSTVVLYSTTDNGVYRDVKDTTYSSLDPMHQKIEILDKTHPNPYMDPTHVQICFYRAIGIQQ